MLICEEEEGGGETLQLGDKTITLYCNNLNIKDYVLARPEDGRIWADLFILKIIETFKFLTGSLHIASCRFLCIQKG